VIVQHAAVVFVHGLFSSARAWDPFTDLIGRDPDLDTLSTFHFEYASPPFNWNPVRQIPDFDTLADSLRTFLEVDVREYDHLALVTHSQGGLVVQRFLARMLHDGRGHELARIRRVVMFACPNSGSQMLLLARRWAHFWRHPQERALRPIDEKVTYAQRTVLSQVVHASGTSPNRCAIPVRAYAGESDRIVTPASAKFVFAETGVIPGDHSSIIRPDRPEHRSYSTLKRDLLAAFHVTAATRQVPRALPAQPARPPDEVIRYDFRTRTLEIIRGQPEFILTYLKPREGGAIDE
jgi:pimeloyl-ACP methyl ester carboxylesterase